MKKFAIYIVSVVLVVAVIDVSFGLASSFYVKNYRLPGDYGSVDYLMKDSKDDILILGSSVAMNSMRPVVIEDSLGMSCFNGGANGQQVIYYRTMLDCVLKKHTPKLVIIGAKMTELRDGGDDRYNFLTPYYHTGYSIIDSCLESRGEYNKFFMRSNLYRYNQSWFRILLYHFMTADDAPEKGFIGKSKPLIPTVMTEETEKGGVTPQLFSDFKNIIEECKHRGIKVMVYFPPMYSNFVVMPASVDSVTEYCHANHIPFYNDLQDSTFLAHNEYFHDNKHLSVEGATVYTANFVSRIKKCLKQ